jgi:hypothetical protein
VSRPSWAVAPAVAVDAAPVRPPATLVAAVVGMAGLVASEVVHVAGRDDLRPVVKVVLIGGIALQVPCGALALRRSPTAAMLLLLCAVSALVAAAASGAVLFAVGAAVVLALLARSLRWFPSVEPWSSR